MKTTRVTIVDYGIGNLYSVKRAFEVCGTASICISNDPAEILAADRVVLPGVGAFADGMRGLQERGLDQAIREFAASGRPLLGICLGMQLFATTSMEFGNHAGLNLIPGQVHAIPAASRDGTALKIPFIGWSPLQQPTHANWDESVLASLAQQQSIYLVHSFHYTPDKQSHTLATYQYGGHDIIAAIKKDNITGLQFHPEKSGKVGLAILSAYLKQEPICKPS
ncbi:glutamine amidotransferase [Vogesella indigofera]|uniref:Imidazole glycerol phosphate synthase subunit HisH n=1 Tax=Vogesella indigofera TaxID=45465 RepID=A0A495BCL6_VOGIN|nr:imidazole glycerol phosphate synthase subunit HisH [Vogesella indigofera]RKQ58708.1 glutamine amidotransferase [Vogesella indigofera]